MTSHNGSGNTFPGKEDLLPESETYKRFQQVNTGHEKHLKKKKSIHSRHSKYKIPSIEVMMDSRMDWKIILEAKIREQATWAPHSSKKKNRPREAIERL